MKTVNANWTADEGRFELMFITDDDQQHVAATSPAAMVALIALARAEAVLLWDPTNRTLIAANIIGIMPWTTQPPSGAPGAVS